MPDVTSEPLGPNAVIGILGGGQLGRMLALAAARLGYRCHILAPEPDSPAFDVARRVTQADYADEHALARFAADVDVVTYEFENVPDGTARFLSTRVPVRPDPAALAITQDRLTEKDFVRGLGLGVADVVAVDDREGLDRAVARLGRPAVLKTRRFGYDGKGQAMIREDTDLDTAYAAIGRAPAILEAFVPFEREVSVVVARDATGRMAAYDLTENEHRDHILHRSLVPARVSPAVTAAAIEVAREIAAGLNYIGVLAVELFALGDRVLVNEIAPRVHNSGHWTMDACVVSQFEQHIRAVAGLPLGDPARHSDVEMINLLGHDVDNLTALLATPGTGVHLYGKPTVRPGRKMGHVNRLMPRTS